MATIKNVTAGKLLQEFVKGYNDEPFGLQGLIIAKQLIDLALPEKKFDEIIISEEFRDLLNDAEAQFNFRNKPFFMAFSNFFIGKTSKELNDLSSSKLKQELIKLIDLNGSSHSFDIESTTYDLSGNPESAYIAKNSLEGALINTTASLLYYLLISGKNSIGKIFYDLNTNIRKIADHVKRINNFMIFFKEFIAFKWNNVSLIGCIPKIDELKVDDICQYVEKHPVEYIEVIRNKVINKIINEFEKPLISTIDLCKHTAKQQSSKFDLEIHLESNRYAKIQNKVISDLQKLKSRIQSGKKVLDKDFEVIKENLHKEFEKIEQRINKEFQDFQKKVEASFFQQPLWFKYLQKGSEWHLMSSDTIIRELKNLLSLEGVFNEQKKSKSTKQMMSIFECLGGIHFALENIVAHYFFERVPFRLIKLVETPAKHQKIKELKFLQDKRYNEGLDKVREYLVENSELILSSLLSQGFSMVKDYYIRENPSVQIDEENIRNPYYLKLFDISKDILEDSPPESYFGKDDFTFQNNENIINVSFNFKSIRGIGNDLYGLIVSSTSLENAEIYRQATKIIGNFSGYVYTGAIGNIRVCPPALKEVSDLFV